jgi:hypothetical protein
MKDPINEAIHRYRAEHARKFKSDVAVICEDLREQSHRPKVVHLPRKRKIGYVPNAPYPVISSKNSATNELQFNRSFRTLDTD